MHNAIRSILGQKKREESLSKGQKHCDFRKVKTFKLFTVNLKFYSQLNVYHYDFNAEWFGT